MPRRSSGVDRQQLAPDVDRQSIGEAALDGEILSAQSGFEQLPQVVRLL
jgi:hypothetical protein